MSRQTKRILQIITGAGLLIFGVMLGTDNLMLKLSVFLAAYLVIGGEIAYRALRNALRGQVFDENLLMTIATVGAFLIGEYAEGVAVMLFFQTGELFQSYAVNKSRGSIASLMDIRPDFANVLRNGEVVTAEPDEVSVGETIIVKAGEKVPLDGVIEEGASNVDMKALTGESVPREVFAGMEILSGTINLSGLLTVSVTKEYGESTVSKILDLVENASAQKAKTEKLITKFARYYTPAVVVLAALISVMPPLVVADAQFSDWLYRGLTFLVISCPCALVISIPLGFFGGIGGASKRGILIKGGNYLEALSRLETVVFDKTGTLTKGVFNVCEVNAVTVEEAELLELAAHAENYSNHPISLSLKRAYGKEIDTSSISGVTEIAGRGVSAVVGGKTVHAGNVALMKEINAVFNETEAAGTVIYVAIDGVFAGSIVIADEIKEDSALAIRALKEQNVRQTVMLTGDRQSVAQRVAAELKLDSVFAELLPDGKVLKLEELLNKKTANRTLAFVGDGINDAPVLARADIGIAMGGLGQDAAIEAADVVIMTDEPSKIATGIKIAKKTLAIIKQNIVFALGVKLGVLLLASIGFVSMWAGIIADVGVSMLCVLNAARVLNTDKL